MTITVSHLTDAQLTAEVARLARGERAATLALLVHLAEFDARRLYLGAAFSSLYRYCRWVLKLSEHEAYHRIVAARAGRRYPMVFDLLASAVLNLTTLRLLAPHLTRANHRQLLEEASGKSKRQVQELLARHFPRPDVPPSIRPLPPMPSLSAPASTPCAGVATDQGHALTMSAARMASATGPIERPIAPPVPAGPEPIVPLAPDRYEMRFTARAALCDTLQRAQDLLRHAVPGGDPGEIFERALDLLLEDLSHRKFGETKSPRPASAGSPHGRHVAAHTRREVSRRSGQQCTFMAGDRRCEERGFLEFDHSRRPFAAGGPTTGDNLRMLCRAHNGYEAERYYGRRMGPPTRSGPSRPPPVPPAPSDPGPG